VKAKAKLVGQAKACISRFTNKVLFTTVLKSLHAWVRKGDKRVRLEMLRNLGMPPDAAAENSPKTPAAAASAGHAAEDPGKCVGDMAYEVINALVLYAAGRTGSGSNEYGFFPYGRDPSCSTQAFTSVPSAWFSVTFAEMYPFIAKDISKWESLRIKRSYKMTGLWPLLVVRRYMQFQRRFVEQRDYLFQQYEIEEGEYHGKKALVVKKKKQEQSQEPGDDSDDSVDLAFV
jgi:hypothetical protein